MLNRIQVRSLVDARHTATLLNARGYKCLVFVLGAAYENGGVLQCGDNALEFAVQVLESFQLEFYLEG